MKILSALFLLSVTSAYSNSPLHTYAQDLLKHDKNVVSVDVDGKKVWFKKPKKDAGNFWSCANHHMTKILPYSMLKKSSYCTPEEYLQTEKRRLEALGAKGIPVPQVLESAEHWMALSDAGAQLEDTVAKNTNISKRKEMLLKAATALGEVHTKGEWHGSAQLKDMTIQDREGIETVGFIDLADDPSDRLSLTDCQARDILNFSLSLMNIVDGDLETFRDVLLAYKASAPVPTWNQAILAAKQLSPYYAVMAPFSEFFGSGRAVDTSMMLDNFLKVARSEN